MVGICIGVGPGWAEAAQRSAARMQAMTGLRCLTLAEDPIGCAHPSWLKCHLLDLYPEEEAIFAFDADLLCMRPWAPWAAYDRGTFTAVAEPPNPAVDAECAAHGLSLPYINAGFAIFDRSHAPIWRATWARHPRWGTWLEQTGLNHALQQGTTRIKLLPRVYNQLVRPWVGMGPEDLRHRPEINVHLAGLGNAQALLALQRALF